MVVSKMPENTITFQLATHYLPKIALHLESLYQTLEQACHETHPVIHHCALKNIIEIIRLIEKPELKSRFLKELIRIEHAINKTPSDVHLHKKITPDLSQRLNIQTKMLSQIVGLFGEGIHHDPFLQSIKQNQPTTHQEEECISPQLLFWLESTPSKRQQDLREWIKQLHLLNITVRLYLSLIRERAIFEPIQTMQGFYQRPLPCNTSCHLILVTLDKQFNMVPRIQPGHRNLTIRLCDAKTLREIKTQNVQASLAVCHF